MSTSCISHHKAVEIIDSSKDQKPLPYIYGIGALVAGLEQEMAHEYDESGCGH